MQSADFMSDFLSDSYLECGIKYQRRLLLHLSSGVTLSLNGRNISTDGSGRVNINDIAFGYGSSALICQSNVTTGTGHWYLHPTEESTEEQDRIKDNSQGWFSTRATTTVNNQQVRQVRLRRATGHTAQEGVLTCHIPEDDDTPITVGIYYPSESNIHPTPLLCQCMHGYSSLHDTYCVMSLSVMSVSASIEVVSGRDGEFKVKCTSTGGRALRMVVTGPGDFSSDLTDIQAVGSVQRVGNDRFSATTRTTISGRSNGDIYQCVATNGVSLLLNSIDHVMLRGDL